jgi:hypothetical protein
MLTIIGNELPIYVPRAHSLLVHKQSFSRSLLLLSLALNSTFFTKLSRSCRFPWSPSHYLKLTNSWYSCEGKPNIRSRSFMSYAVGQCTRATNLLQTFSVRAVLAYRSLFYPHWIKVRKLSPFPSRALWSLQTVNELVVKVQGECRMESRVSTV